jgi:flagellum-specific ATP synthase
LGAYVKGSNKKIDVSINYHENIIGYLKQGMNEKSDFEESINYLKGMFN